MRSPLPLGAALLAALSLSALAPRVRADIAPSPGFVETCTLKKQSSAGRQCFACSAYHGNAMHCSESLADYGFAQSCRSSGASVWSEVWCRAASPTARPVPKDVLGQLENSSGHPPSPAAPPSAATAAPLPSAPASSPTAAPTAAPTADASAAPVAPVAPVAPGDPAAPAEPPPLPPPPGGCGGCAAPGPETAVWAPMLALGALAIAWSRRRGRR